MFEKNEEWVWNRDFLHVYNLIVKAIDHEDKKAARTKRAKENDGTNPDDPEADQDEEGTWELFKKVNKARNVFAVQLKWI